MQGLRRRGAPSLHESVFIKDESGEIIELRCTYDPDTKGGDSPDGRKVKATLHWVSTEHAGEAEVRLYDHLFVKEDPHDIDEGQYYLENLNPSSIEEIEVCKVEPSLMKAKTGGRYQFERLGYFCVDKDSTDKKPVFNRTVTLRDTWARIQKGNKK